MLGSRISVRGAGGGGVSDHGALNGLVDDDHAQYHNNTRGDIRYYTQGQIDTIVSGASAAYKTIYVDAGAMIFCTTNGAQYAQVEKETNDIDLCHYAFDGGATEERVQFKLTMPEDWDLGTIKAKFYWSSATGSTAGDDQVTWAVKAGAIKDSDPIDAALGTSRAVEDTLLAGSGTDMQITEATPAITVGGSYAVELNDLLIFEIFRDTDGSVETTTDDMTEDAWLFGCLIQYYADVNPDVW